MEILLLLAVLVLVIILIRNLSDVKRELTSFRHDLSDFKDAMRIAAQRETTNYQETISTPPVEAPEIRAPETKRVPEIANLTVREPETPLGVMNIPNEQQQASIFHREETESAVPPYSNSNRFRKWLLENPDIEKFIGENLINKIGIAVLVLGIAFFVKYAIDQEWINKIGRVGIGLFCGISLIWLANRLRKNYHAFSSVLVGGGLTDILFHHCIRFSPVPFNWPVCGFRHYGNYYHFCSHPVSLV